MSEHLREMWRQAVSKTAMPADADFLGTLVWRAFETHFPGTPLQRQVTCKTPDGQQVGHLRWLAKDYKRPPGKKGEITYVFVQPEYQRRGVATEMLARARRIDPDVHHSGVLTEDGSAWSQVAASKTAMDYWTGHRPSQAGAPAHDLLAPDEEQGVPLYPDDIYDRPDYYTGFRDLVPELKRLLHSIRGNPNAPVTIYRALPPNKGTRFETGDWVSLSREYAEMHGEDRGWEEWVEPAVPNVFEEGEGWVRHEGDWSIISATVPASTVRFAGDDLMEWGYWGPPIPGRVQ